MRLRGRLFLSTKSFAPRQPVRLPLSKTSLISFLLFKRSARLNRSRSKQAASSTSGALIGLFLVRSSQFIPALGPAAFQHQPSAPCFHSGAKSEFTVSLNLAGLISSLHNFLLVFIVVFNGNIRRHSRLGNNGRFNFALFQNFLHLLVQVLAVLIV